MNREVALVVAAAAVFGLAAVTAVALPGAVADPADDEVTSDPPGEVSIAEATIAADEVTGGTAVLAVDTHLDHRGGPVENVTVVYRATDTNTGLVEDSREVEVGTIEDESERVVDAAVTVPRESSYRIETVVYANGTRTTSSSQTVDGVASLTPAYADTDVEFHRFGSGYGYGSGVGDLPAIEYTVESVDEDADRAALEVSTYLTNTGDEPEGDLRLEVTARQSGSNVVADADAVAVDEIEPGATATPSLDLEVPGEYDYYLDAILWTDGTIVETSRATANLGPGNLTVDATEREGGLEVSDFETDDDGPSTERGPDDERDVSGDGQPGVGALGAVAALALVAVALARTPVVSGGSDDTTTNETADSAASERRNTR